MCEKRKKEKKVITCFKQVNFDIKFKIKKKSLEFFGKQTIRICLVTIFVFYF